MIPSLALRLFCIGAAWSLTAGAAETHPTPEAKLAALGLALPSVPPVIANYVPAVRSGNLVFLAGQIARGADGKFLAGKVGRDFTAQPKVINGASDLLVAVFGEKGRHARAAVGVNALPAGAPVEIELIAEIATP